MRRQNVEAEVERIVAASEGRIARIEKRAKCVCCGGTVTVGFMLTRPPKAGRICASCVSASWVKTLPQEAEDWSPKAVCALLSGDAAARIRGICACNAHSEKQVGFGFAGIGFVETSALGKSIDVFRQLLECAAFPGKEWSDRMVCLLADRQVREVLVKDRMWDVVLGISPDAPPRLIAGAASIIAACARDTGAVIGWLCAFRDHSDALVTAAVEASLKALGASDFDEAAENLKLRPLIDELMDAFRLDDLKRIVATVRRVSGIDVPGKNKEAIATGLARTLGRPDYLQTFYDALSSDIKQVINYLAWKKMDVAPEQVETETGVAVVQIEKRSYYETVTLKPAFSGILVCESRYYGSAAKVGLHPWFKQRLKPILPLPEKARLHGTDEPPNFPGSRVFQTEPAFPSRFPALDAMCQQGVIARKKNGEPTVAGLRSLHSAGWRIEEFYPDVRKAENRRLELLVRLGDIAATSPLPRTDPADVLQAWLDALLKPGESPVKLERRKKRSAPFHLPKFARQLKGLPVVLLQTDHANTCLRSMNTAMTSIPQGQWVTFRDLCDFILYNDLPLPIPGACYDAYMVIPNEWGYTDRQHAGVAPEDCWEKPLLRALLVALLAVGAVDAVIAPPPDGADDEGDDDYLLATDALRAVRLTAIGEWYFQGESPTCFEVQDTGEVILDERRLFIRLTGSNPVLQVALEQLAQSLGSGFYRIDGGSFLKDCKSEAQVQQKVDTLKSLLPAVLPPIWTEFFQNLLQRVNPLTPAKFTVLELGESPEFRQLLLTDPTLRALVVMAEGGRILVRASANTKLKK
ncbi:MAG: hypothetical protein ACI8W8_000542, partial [Rhodothermales bacterium]